MDLIKTNLGFKYITNKINVNVKNTVIFYIPDFPK